MQKIDFKHFSVCRVVPQQLQLSSQTTDRRSDFRLLLWSIHKMTNIKTYAFHISTKFYAFNVWKTESECKLQIFHVSKIEGGNCFAFCYSLFLFQIYCLWWKQNQIMLFGFTWTIEMIKFRYTKVKLIFPLMPS